MYLLIFYISFMAYTEVHGKFARSKAEPSRRKSSSSVHVSPFVIPKSHDLLYECQYWKYILNHLNLNVHIIWLKWPYYIIHVEDTPRFQTNPFARNSYQYESGYEWVKTLALIMFIATQTCKQVGIYMCVCCGKDVQIIKTGWCQI